MAAANYLATRAEVEEFHDAESVERRHIRTVPEGEREEVSEILRGLGIAGDLLHRVVATITADRDRWVRMMLRYEYGTVGCGTFAVARRRVHVLRLFGLRTGSSDPLRGGPKERILGGVGRNQPDVPFDWRSQKPLVDRSVVAVRSRDSWDRRRSSRGRVRLWGLATHADRLTAEVLGPELP